MAAVVGGGVGGLTAAVALSAAGFEARESWTDPGDVAELRAAFDGWHPTVRAIVEALDGPLKWALFDRAPLPRWSEGAVTLLGDACHPVLPYGAQGAAQSIEDAAALVACLSAHEDQGIAAALRRYEEVRRDRASRVQAISRANGIRFHLPDGPEQVARDEAMATSFGISAEIDRLYGNPAPEPAR